MACGYEERPAIERIEEILRECGHDKSRVIPILQAIQEEFQYLPSEAMVPRAPDLPHPSGAEGSDDLVGAEPIAR